MRIIVASAVGLAMGCLAGRAVVQPGDDFNANTAIAASALQQWYNRDGLWDTTGWWNAANCVEAIENVITAQNGGPYLRVLDKTYRRNVHTRFLNEFYDDEGWWALAWIRAFDLTGEARYLRAARTIFNDMAASWDSHCGGGIWWKKGRRYKNAIANELFFLTAIRLHQRTPNDEGTNSYLDWATREWTWFDQSGMINSQNLVNDGLSRWCENNGRTTWTYNQGVILGGLAELYKSTGNTNYLRRALEIADAAITTLNDGKGILAEPCEPDNCGGEDVPQFKGIFIHHLAELYDLTRNPSYYQFLLANAHSVWAKDRDSSNRFGLSWNGPVDTVDAARHSSAMMAISALAEPATAELVFVKGSGSPGFNHDVGTAAGTLAWTCGPGTHRGFMQSGPYLAFLPKGAHIVRFRLAVDSTSQSIAQLAQLDVRESRNGALLATRAVAWNEFRSANETQDFALHFINPAGNDPLEFRVFWNAVSNAPALTLTDTAVGDSRSWTAANLAHEVGQLDGLNAWCADPVRNHASGFLTRGATAYELSPGHHSAVFELKVDNFNWDNCKIATLSIVETDSERVLVTRELTRSDFATILYQTFVLKFNAAAGRGYDFRVFWHYGPRAPRLTQRSIIIR